MGNLLGDLMAKTYAKVNLAIWQDPEFRRLPLGAQHLYLFLWTHSTLSYCGVAEWNPKRIQAFTEGWTAADVAEAARCLEARLFIVTSPDTDEVLLRSWVRHDGLLKEWRMGIAFAKAYVTVASRELQQVIVHEGLLLRRRQPELAAWTHPQCTPQVLEVLSNEALDPRERSLPEDPFGPGLPTDSPSVGAAFGPNAAEGQGSVSHPPTTTTSTTTSTCISTTSDNGTSESTDSGKTPRKRGSRIPEGFAVDEDMKAWAAKEAPDVDAAATTVEFIDYWAAIPGAKGVKLDWVATWRNWVRRRQGWALEKKQAPATRTPPATAPSRNQY